MCRHRSLYATGKTLLARLAREVGDYEAEHRHLEDAVRHAPESDHALLELCQHFFARELWQQAIIALQELIRRGTHDEAAYCNLGTVYMRAGHEDDARCAYARVLEINPDNEVARRNLQYVRGE